MKTLRTIVEYLSRGKLLKRKIVVNGKKIPIFVSPDAQLKYLKPGIRAFDRDLIDISEKYLTSKSNVWDIGANVGIFTFAASSIANKGTIVSIEADVWLASILRKTACLKEYVDSNIYIVPAAVSNQNSIASFSVAARGRASNALASVGGRSQMGGVRERQYVPTLTLDTVLESFSSPDFIKIDVEGAECMVIQGATRILSEIRPIFYIEVGKESSAQISDIFKQSDYCIFDREGKALLEPSAKDNNIFFVPKEIAKAW